MAPQLLTTAEAATYLNLSPRTLEGWRSRFEGPVFVKTNGRTVRYREEDLEQWVNESIQGGTA